MLETNIYNLKNREIEQLVQFYTDNHKKVDTHPDKRDLLNNEFNDIALERQREDVLNELLYYQAFIEAYNNAYDVNSSKKFYIELRNLNKNFFSNYINVDPCIAEKSPPVNLYQDNNSIDNFNGMRSNFSEVKPKAPVIERNFYYDEDLEISKDNEYKETVPAFDPYEYNRQLMEKERLDKMKSENDKLAQALYDLERQKEQLSRKVKDLEGQSNRSQLKTSHIRATSAQNKDYKNEGFQQVLRSKEEQIQTLQLKVSQLEKEHQRIADHEVVEDIGSYRTPCDNRSRIRSKVNNSYLKTNDRATDPYVYSGKKYDNTGSEFVDQMYNNINKLLNKSNHRSVVREQSYVY